MEDKAFERLLLKVKNNRGLDLSGYKEAFVRRRLMSRFRNLGIDNLSDYCLALDRNPDEYAKLIDVLAINVTEFFRDPTLFTLFSSKVIPELQAKCDRSSMRMMRFLSAGGATGEEAYSLAIALRETLGEDISNYSITIQLIDIDTDCIAKAKKGVYHIDRLRNVSKDLLSIYFTREGPEHYKIKPEIRKMVTFYTADLLAGRIPRCFDVILCRNVLIYFSREAHEDLFFRLHASLSINGFLILGRSETLIGKSKDLFDTFDSKERVYRRKECPPASLRGAAMRGRQTQECNPQTHTHPERRGHRAPLR